MRILILAKNFENYLSGYYHDDIVKAWMLNSEKYWIWGPGYPNYNSEYNLENIIKLKKITNLSLIVFSTSWDDDESVTNVDPNQNINCSNTNINTLYYLNKEYKKLNERFNYIKKNKFNYVITMNLNWKLYQKKLGSNFKVIHSHFGYNENRFVSKDKINDRKWDFGFTGGLHQTHNDLRFDVKKQIFKNNYILKKSNISRFKKIKKRYTKNQISDFKIYWAEWGSKDFLNRSLLPFGKRYFSFLSDVKVFLSTPSADGLINTRFFELLACGTIIICPYGHDYDEILIDKFNCVMYRDGDFLNTLYTILSNKSRMQKISLNAIESAKFHNYNLRIEEIIKNINNKKN